MARGIKWHESEAVAIAIRAVVWTVGSAGGVIVGGPIAAGLGGGLASALSEGLTVLLTKRAEDFGDELEGGGAVAEVGQALRESPEFVAMFADATQAALRTDWKPKVRLLAWAATEAAHDDARIDELARLVSTARAIEAPEARLLVQLSRPVPDESAQASDPAVGIARQHSPNAHRRHDLIDPGEEPGPMLDASLAVLMREGLAIDTSGWDQRGLASFGITKYGRLFLEWLSEVGGAREELGSDLGASDAEEGGNRLPGTPSHAAPDQRKRL